MWHPKVKKKIHLATITYTATLINTEETSNPHTYTENKAGLSTPQHVNGSFGVTVGFRTYSAANSTNLTNFN